MFPISMLQPIHPARRAVSFNGGRFSIILGVKKNLGINNKLFISILAYDITNKCGFLSDVIRYIIVRKAPSVILCLIFPSLDL